MYHDYYRYLPYKCMLITSVKTNSTFKIELKLLNKYISVLVFFSGNYTYSCPDKTLFGLFLKHRFPSSRH